MILTSLSDVSLSKFLHLFLNPSPMWKSSQCLHFDGFFFNLWRYSVLLRIDIKDRAHRERDRVQNLPCCGLWLQIRALSGFRGRYGYNPDAAATQQRVAVETGSVDCLEIKGLILPPAEHMPESQTCTKCTYSCIRHMPLPLILSPPTQSPPFISILPSLHQLLNH